MGNLYGGTLVLGNGFSSTFKQFGSDMNNAGNKFKQFTSSSENSAKKSSNAWKSSFNDANKEFDKFHSNIMSKITKITAGFLSVKGAISGIKEVLKAGSEFENASVFLKATYGDKLGGEKFKWATQEANKTPFSETEVANGLARAHSLGLADDEKSFKMYEDMGSYASIQGVGDLNSAIDAIVDAQSGNWMRLQTITGIKREGLEAFAKSNSMSKFSNKKGQVTDTQQLMKVLEAYMGEKGILGMTDKFSKTLSGRMSTLGGNFKKALAELGGIKDDGTLEEGGLFDQACKGVEKLIKSVNAFAKSPSFDKLKDALGKMGEAIIKGFDYLTTHPDAVSNLIKLGGAFVGLKIVSGLISPFATLTSGLSSLGTVLGSLSKINFAGLSNGLSSLGTSGKTNSLVGKAVATGSKVAPAVIASAVVGGAVVNNDNWLHKFGNAINPANIFAKEGEKEDYLAQIYAYSSKAGIWGLNKLGIINDDNANKGYSNADQYIQNANDYINGKTNKTENLRDMNEGIANRTNNITINNNIAKEVDSDSLLMKIANIFKNKDGRNSVYA